MKTFKQYLTESINDKGIFKAVFMGGSPGSGKTFVMNKLKSGQIEPRVVNTDRALEYYAKRDDIDLSKQYDYAYVDKSKRTTQQMLVQYINGMLPLFIDGTSANPNNLLRRIGMLESYGYDVAMVWVNTDVETAVERIQQRSRQVPEEMVRKVHQTAEENRQYYQNKFDTFVEINNNDGMLDEETVTKAFNKTTGFFTSDIQNPVGQRVVQQAKEHGYKYLAPHFHDLQEIQQNVAVWYRKG